MIEFLLNMALIEQILLGLLLVVFLYQLYFYLRYLAVSVSTIKSSNSTAPNYPVSVIICAHNEGDNLQNFLPSVLQQDYPEYEVIVKATTLTSTVTLGRVARSILRIKGRIVKISPDVITNGEQTVLELRPDYVSAGVQEGILIKGPVKTRFFDDMVQAQLDYQQKAKADPTWTKRN